MPVYTTPIMNLRLPLLALALLALAFSVAPQVARADGGSDDPDGFYEACGKPNDWVSKACTAECMDAYKDWYDCSEDCDYEGKGYCSPSWYVCNDPACFCCYEEN